MGNGIVEELENKSCVCIWDQLQWLDSEHKEISQERVPVELEVN